MKKIVKKNLNKKRVTALTGNSFEKVYYMLGVLKYLFTLEVKISSKLQKIISRKINQIIKFEAPQRLYVDIQILKLNIG